MPTVHKIEAVDIINLDFDNPAKVYKVTVSYPEFHDPEIRSVLFDNLKGFAKKKPNEGITVTIQGWSDTVKVAEPERFGPEFNEDWIRNYFA